MNACVLTTDRRWVTSRAALTAGLTAIAWISLLAIPPTRFALADELSQETTVAGQDSEKAEKKPEIAEPTKIQSGPTKPVAPAIALPKVLPDGRLLRSIGIADSQKFELIPPNYYPVETDRLVDAIKRWNDLTVETPSSQLRSAEFWVDLAGDTLTCRRGFVEVESDGSGWTSQPLGKVNFAISDDQWEDAGDETSAARTVSLADGTLVAFFQSKPGQPTRIPLHWKNRGTSAPRGHVYELKFPRTPQTRFVFSVNAAVQLESDNGVLRELDGPPSEFDARNSGESLRWYELDAGGLDSLRLKSFRRQRDVTAEAIVIRRNAVEYNVDSSGLFFIQRVELALPIGAALPRLRVVGARMTSLKVNASEASFVQLNGIPLAGDLDGDSSESVSASDYQVVSPPGAIGSQETRVSLTVMGQAEWQDVCNLPLAGFIADPDQPLPIVDACVSDEARVSISPTARLVEWELPSGWIRLSAIDVDSLDVETASGTSLFALFQQTSIDSQPHSDSRGKKNQRKPWSRLRLSTPTHYQVRDLWLRSEVGESEIIGDARFEFHLNERGLEPLKFTMEAGWRIDSVSFLDSGRVIEAPSIDAKRRLLTVWPEMEDYALMESDAALPPEQSSSLALRIRISGARPNPVGGSRIVVPPTWMIRVCDDRANPILSEDFTAAVVPPAEMNWAGDTAMMPHRVSADRLNEDQRRFFKGEDSRTLYFKPRHRQLDALGLETPSVDYQARLSLKIEKLGDEISERLFVNVSSGGRSLDKLVVHTGPAVSRPLLRWIIPGQNGSLSTTLAASDVELADSDGQGVYTINVAGLDLASRPLMAYRSYPAKNLSMDLPSVPSAISGTSQLYIGEGLEIANKSKGVQLVPRSIAQHEGVSESNSSDLVDSFPERDDDSKNTEPVSTNIDNHDGLHLRYDAVQQPSIELAVAKQEHSVNVITRSEIRVVASSRGTDRVEALVRASLSKPLVIGYAPELQLVSISRDGKPVDKTGLAQLPLVLPPQPGAERGKPELIRLVWNRSHVGFHLFRRCRMPRVEYGAAVLKNEYHLVAAVDTFAPRALLKGNGSTESHRKLEMSPDEETFLIRRNVMLAVGWLIALFNFIGAWIAVKRSPVAVFVYLAVLCVSALLWWTWRMTVVGWFIVPVIAAAMLVAARQWTVSGHQNNDSVIERQSELVRAEALSDPSTEFSWESMLRSWMFAIAITVALSGSSSLQAQSNQSGLSGQTVGNRALTGGVGINRVIGNPDVAVASGVGAARFRTPVNVIIPMGTDHRQTGEFVYIPNSLHQQLFNNQTQVTVQQPTYASAEYLLKIREVDPSKQTVVDAVLLADYEIEFPNQAEPTGGAGTIRTMTQCLIPIGYDRIEKIEMLGSDPTTLRYLPGPGGGTIVALPQVKAASIRISMRLLGSRQGLWAQFSVGVPSVSASRIDVESEFDLQVLRLGGVGGRLLDETDLRRWSDVLGPTNLLEIGFRMNPQSAVGSPQQAKPLQRRYWVSAGLTTTTIDCEVDPPEAVAAGESIQFVIRDSAMPILMSPDWRLLDTEIYAPKRRRVSVISVRDSPGPIQLLWKLSNHDQFASHSDAKIDEPDVANGDAAMFSDFDQVEIRIPEVIASSLGENAPAWIALRCLDSLTFDPMPRGSKDASIEPLSVDQFLAGWSGYRGRIDRAFVALGDIPTPRLRRSPPVQYRIEDRHRLRISPRRLQLSYEADVTPGVSTRQPYLLSLPSSIQLVDLYVAGVRQRPVFIDSGSRRYVPIDRQTRFGEPFKVTAFAIGEIPPRGQFEPPVLVLGHSDNSEPTSQSLMKNHARESSYTVSRTNDSFIQIVEPFAAEASRSAALMTAESLADGYLPVATWEANSDDTSETNYLATNISDSTANGDESNRANEHASGGENFWQGNWGGVFRVQQRMARFDCEQLITLERRDRDWQVSNQIHFLGQRVPDYVDLEIPTRWCESLEITPSTAWSRQPSTSDLRQVIRVRCDRTQFLNQPLVVTGMLSQKDDGRVSVPNIRILGAGKRGVYIQVPRRLTSESVQWRTTRVEEARLPKFFAGFQDSPLAYRASHENWSIDLAPLPELSMQPIAIIQDNQVFLGTDSLCVLTHWDVSPGSRERLWVGIPEDAECLGAWSGGMTVATKNTKSADDQSAIEIPLSLSQLPQTVKLLIRVPANRVRRGDYVPRLIDIPVNQSWLAIYQPETSEIQSKAGISEELVKLRRLSLARSTVESVEFAVDIVAERSSDEVVPWLTPWVYRYLELAWAAGRKTQLSQIPSNDLNGDVLNEYEPNGDEPESVDVDPSLHPLLHFEEIQWKWLDKRISVYANRFVPDLQAQFDPSINAPKSVAVDSANLRTMESTNRRLNYQSFLGDEAIFSASAAPGFRLDQVLRLASTTRAPPLRAFSNNDLRLRNVLGNAITLILVVAVLACLHPLKGYLLPLVAHPAFWLAALGVAGLFVAPTYVALSLVLVAISMPWFPSRASRQAVSVK
jgi:hypothetical protein